MLVLRMKRQVLHRERVHLKVPGSSLVLRALLTKKLPNFLSRSNEIMHKCTLCNKLYIGETGRRLGNRSREHLRDAEKNDKDASKPIAPQPLQKTHGYLRPFPTSTTETRKNLEQKFIFQIGTLNPHGINEGFSFN